MTPRRKYIEGLAQQALNTAHCIEPPVPVHDVAKALGLDVVPFAFHNKISGLLKEEDGVIGVNKMHHPLRQRFTIAHELGHFLLGHGMGTAYREEMVEDAFDKPNPLEREANLFASLLLMPSEWVKKQVKKNGLDIDSLSRSFEVSRQAMTIRLLELKLIK
jgi:Zn-dependent peptidase ImmA (M78 family)